MPKSPAVELANKPKLEANTQNASQKTEAYSCGSKTARGQAVRDKATRVNLCTI